MKTKWWVVILCLMLALTATAGCQSSASGTEPGVSASNESTIYGQVTAIDTNSITLALGTMSAEFPGMDGENPGTPPDGQQENQGAPPIAQPSSNEPDANSSATLDNATAGAGQPDAVSSATENNGEMPSDGRPDNSGQPGGAPPSGGQPGGGALPGFIELSGEEMTITVSDITAITVQGMGESTEGALSDIEVGDILSVTMSGDTVTAITVMQGGNMQGSPQGAESTGITLAGATTVSGTTETLSEKTLSSTSSDENTVLVTDEGSLTISGATLTKSGDTSSADNSNFYGLNAIFAVTQGSTASISDTILNSSGEGSNAIFATGENAVITADNVTIHTTGNSARGLDATYGGMINATNVYITTEGAHCAPIATDRGEGTITVDGGTLSASGDGSPNIYSTGSITVSNVTGTATGSQIAVVEGKNAITITNCDLTGAGLNGIMLYQSTSGDAAEGTANFTATDCTLTTTSSGPMFYVTNTDAEATLENTTLNFSGGILVNAAGNDTNNWGTPGSNGGSFMLTGINQLLTGDVTCDSISSFGLVLTEGAVFTGAIDAAHTAQQTSISLDKTSVWNVTGDSYVTVITNALTDCSNIISNGCTIYYDASNTANAWLNGATISLSGGGTLTPMA